MSLPLLVSWKYFKGILTTGAVLAGKTFPSESLIIKNAL